MNFSLSHHREQKLSFFQRKVYLNLGDIGTGEIGLHFTLVVIVSSITIPVTSGQLGSAFVGLGEEIERGI